MAENSVTVVGNLTRDPELRFTAGGKGVASFGLAVNRRYQVNGEWQEKVSFFNVTAWDTLGENAAASLNKGARIIVTGRLEQRDYETQSGEKRNVVEIVADELGPSLRWARAEVERTQRTGPDGTPSGGRPAAAPSGGRASDPVYGDEEPF
ncbi:MAG TPA: single-stranded DNA-binding protein [Ilumatobacteraceae bacterium]|jgi:single-strand DNA-binding protein